MKKVFLLAVMLASIVPFIAAQSIGPVTEPAGEPALYSRTELKRTILYEEEWDSGIADLIYFDNDDVYIPNLMSDCADGTYIHGKITEGDRQNGVITFLNGAYVSGNHRVYIATRDEYGYLVSDYAADTFHFDIIDGVITPPYSTAEGGTIILLAESQSQWSDITLAAIIYEFRPFTEPETFTVPDNLEWKKYELYCDKVDDNDPVKPRFAQVAHDGNDFYITGFNDRYADLVLKGTLGTDNKVVFPFPAYLGIHNRHICSLLSGRAKANIDKFGLFTNYTYEIIDGGGELTMTYSPDDESLLSTDMFIIATGDKAYPGHLYKPQLILSQEIEQSVVPADGERVAYQMLSTDLAIPDANVRTATKIEVVRDGDDIYFVNFDPMYPGLGFKGTYNADGTKISVSVPQYLGKSQYDEDIYFYTVATDVEPSLWYEGFYDVRYQTNDVQRVLTFTVDGETITSTANLAAAPQFGTPYYAMIKAQYSPYTTGEIVEAPASAPKANYLASSLTYPGSKEKTSAIVAVSTDGNNYYIKGINPNYPELSFKGTYSAADKAVKVEMPQYMGTDAAGNDIFLTACVARAQDYGWGDPSLVLDADYSPCTLILAKNGDNFTASTTFCAVKYGTEPLAAMIEATFEPYDKSAPEIPADAVFEKYAFTRTILDGWTGELRPEVTDVAHAGDKYYIIHDLAGNGKMIMEGTIVGKQLLVPANQYVGTTQPLYVCPGDVVADYWSPSYTPVEKDYIEFSYNPSTGEFSTTDNIVIYLEGGKMLDYIGCPTYKRYTPTATAPATPIPLNWQDRSGWWGKEYRFDVDIPCADPDGNYLDVKSIFYEIFLDDDVYTFTPEVYYYDDFDGPTTEIAYDRNSNCFTADAISDTHMVTIYDSPQQYIGVRSIFVYEGQKYYSPIAKMDIYTKEVIVEQPMAELPFSFASTDATATWGTQSGDAYDVAVSLCDANLVGKKIKSVKIPVVASDDISDYSVWLSTKLKLNNKTNAPDILSAAVAPEGDMIEYTFAQPYEITADGCYAGYSFIVDNVTDITRAPVVVCNEANEGGFFIHTTGNYRTWADRSAELGVTSAMVITLEGEFAENAAALRQPAPIKTTINTPVKATVRVVNHGSCPIGEIEYTCNANGFDQTGTVTLGTPIPAVYNRAADVEFELPEFVQPGTFYVDLKISKVNSKINIDTEASAEVEVKVFSVIPVNRPVVEEWTGTWCGWCTVGFVALDKMKELHPDEFIAISYHNEDPMMLDPDHYPDMAEGFPTAFINRTQGGNPYYMHKDDSFGLEEAWLNAREAYVPVDITINSATANDETLTVNASVEWIETPAPGEYAIEYVVVADDVHNMANGWIQQNYLSGYDSEVYPDFAYFCTAPKSIVNYHFNDVAILNTGNKGVDGSIPADVAADVPVNHEYVFDLTNVVNYEGKAIPFDKDKMRVVAMLVKRDSQYGKVINSYMKDVTYISGITGVAADAKVISTTYYDLTGRVVERPDHGVYVRVIRYANGTSLSQKVVK